MAHKFTLINLVAVWLGVNTVGLINKHRASVVLRRVIAGLPSWYLTKPPRPTQPSQPSVGRHNGYCPLLQKKWQSLHSSSPITRTTETPWGVRGIWPTEVFSARQHAERAICYRPSVCLSVRLSHGWISQKRLNVSSKFFHHLIGPTF